MNSTENTAQPGKVSPLGIAIRVVFGVVASIPFTVVFSTLLLGGMGQAVGVVSFRQFVEAHLRSEFVSLGIGAVSAVLLYLLIRKRPVAWAMLASSVAGIVFQSREMASMSAMVGMPASLFLVAEQHLLPRNKWNWLAQLAVLTASIVFGAFLGATILLMRQKMLT